MREHYCWLCGVNYGNISFKSGYVCEDCIDYIKSSSEVNNDTDDTEKK